MYIKKSFVNGLIMTLGGSILVMLAIMFCFTELPIPGIVYSLAWVCCIYFMVSSICRIGRAR